MAATLAVFDFDHTILSVNSDVVLANLLPLDVLKTPEFRALQSKWTAYMDQVFRLLPQYGYSKEVITEKCQNFEPTDGMIDLLKYLSSINADIVILSDSNSFIISTWVNHNIPDVKITKIITNPASWVGDALHVEPLRNQTDCGSCSRNLCKGAELDALLTGAAYDLVLYTGDGKNDFCPSKKLRRPTDLVFARKNFKLAELLTNNPVIATVHIWKSAREIQQKIQR